MWTLNTSHPHLEIALIYPTIITVWQNLLTHAVLIKFPFIRSGVPPAKCGPIVPHIQGNIAIAKSGATSNITYPSRHFEDTIYCLGLPGPTYAFPFDNQSDQRLFGLKPDCSIIIHTKFSKKTTTFLDVPLTSY